MGADSIVKLAASDGVLVKFRSSVLAKPILSTLASLALISLIFIFAPGIDLAVSSLFYEPTTGFIGRKSATAEFVRDFALKIEWAFAIGVSLSILTKAISPQSRLFLRPRSIVFVIASFALGPGLIVNGLLKTFWGRARPREVLEFGGGSTFSPAWFESNQCAGNCSFVSGEAASAFFLVTMVLLVKSTWRPAAALLAALIAVAVSLARIAAGAHFLSDVLVAWLVVLLVIAVLNQLVLIGLPPSYDDKAEAALAHAGKALHALFGLRRRPPPDVANGSGVARF